MYNYKNESFQVGTYLLNHILNIQKSAQPLLSRMRVQDVEVYTQILSPTYKKMDLDADVVVSGNRRLFCFVCFIHSLPNAVHKHTILSQEYATISASTFRISATLLHQWEIRQTSCHRHMIVRSYIKMSTANMNYAMMETSALPSLQDHAPFTCTVALP